MIDRNAAPTLATEMTRYPVVTVTGPRQSGKTTLCRTLFPDKPYVSFEPLDVRDRVRDDVRGFLAEHRGGAILDEVQHVPGLLPALQVEVDADPTPGRFLLTGSQHFGLAQGIAQSLAGRTAVLQLLPPSFEELRRFGGEAPDLWTAVWTGAYPRIHDRGLPASGWLGDYVATYVQRDVRQIANIGDLSTFTTFLRLCAARTGQELNLAALGADAGISQATARAWLSVLEASWLVHRLPPWHANASKRWIKAPKLHFFDTGLVCWLLGIHAPSELRLHPLRGAVVESWVVSEVYKAHVHARRDPRLFHWREVRGAEVDLVIDAGLPRWLVEVKSGATVASDALAGLRRALAGADGARARLVYGGDERHVRGEVEVCGWAMLRDADWLTRG
jgi:uncharacterized protein